jgi:hypothetical protein
VVISNHDRLRRAGSNNPAHVIYHGKVHIEANLLSMMSAIASDSQRQNDRAG